MPQGPKACTPWKMLYLLIKCSRPQTYRHNTDLALAGLDDAGAVRANQPRFALVLQNFLHLHHVVLGDALCDAHHLWSHAHMLLTHASSKLLEKQDLELCHIQTAALISHGNSHAMLCPDTP